MKNTPHRNRRPRCRSGKILHHRELGERHVSPIHKRDYAGEKETQQPPVRFAAGPGSRGDRFGGEGENSWAALSALLVPSGCPCCWTSAHREIPRGKIVAQHARLAQLFLRNRDVFRANGIQIEPAGESLGLQRRRAATSDGPV